MYKKLNTESNILKHKPNKNTKLLQKVYIMSLHSNEL